MLSLPEDWDYTLKGLCVGIYAVLIQSIAGGGDPIGAIWGTIGYTVLLCYCLFKTGSIARSVLGAH